MDRLPSLRLLARNICYGRFVWKLHFRFVHCGHRRELPSLRPVILIGEFRNGGRPVSGNDRLF